MAFHISVSEFCLLCGELTKNKKIPKFQKRIKNPGEKLMQVLGFSMDALEVRVFGQFGLGLCKPERMFCECCETWINRGIYLQNEMNTVQEKLLEAACLYAKREDIKNMMEDSEPDPCKESYREVRKLITQWTENYEASTGINNLGVTPITLKSPQISSKPKVSIRSQCAQTDTVSSSDSPTKLKSCMKSKTVTFTVQDTDNGTTTASASIPENETSLPPSRTNPPAAKRNRKSMHSSVLVPEIVFEDELAETTSPSSESVSSIKDVSTNRVMPDTPESKATKLTVKQKPGQGVGFVPNVMNTRSSIERAGIPVVKPATPDFTGPKVARPVLLRHKRKVPNVSKTCETIAETSYISTYSVEIVTNLSPNSTAAKEDPTKLNISVDAATPKNLTASAVFMEGRNSKSALQPNASPQTFEVPVKGNESSCTGTILDFRDLSTDRDDRYFAIFREPATNMLECHQCPACDYQCTSSNILALHNQEAHSSTEDSPAENFTFTCDVCKKEFVQNNWKWVENNQDCYAVLQKDGVRRLFSKFTELCECHLLRCLNNLEQSKKPRIVADLPVTPTIIRKPWSQNYYICQLCNLRFKPKYFAMHVQELHGLENIFERHFFCAHCSRPYLSRRSEAGTGEFFNDEIEDLKTFISTHSFCKQNQSCEPFSQSCKFCSFQYSNTRNLILHEIEWHTENGEYQCGECSRRFATDSLLRRHLRSAHGQARAIPCEICLKPFTLPALHRHMASHNQTLYECATCNKMFLSMQHLEEHLCNQETILEVQEYPIATAQTVHIVRSDYMCHICTIVYPTAEMLSLHFQEHHDKCADGLTFKCEACNFKTEQEDFETVETATSGAYARKYFVTIDGRQKPVSTFCDVVENHVRRCKACKRRPNTNNPEQNEELFSCYKCSEKIQARLPRFITAHLHAHHGKPLYPCPLCHFQFENVAAMRSHANKKHGLTFTQGTHCHCKHCKVPFMPDCPDITGGNFRPSDLEKLIEFQREHAECRNNPPGYTVLVCKFCDKIFENPSQLFSHEVKVHTKKFPFPCDQCEKGYTKSFLLSYHVKSKHLGIKKQPRPIIPKVYICDKCGKVCKGHWRLLEHQRRTHKEEKDIACDSCGELFLTRAARNRHNAIVHKPVESPCPICNVMCPNKYKLKSHIISHNRATVNLRDRLRRKRAKADREAQGIFDGRLKQSKAEKSNPVPKSKLKPKPKPGPRSKRCQN